MDSEIMFENFSGYDVKFLRGEIPIKCNSSLFLGQKSQILDYLEDYLKNDLLGLIFLDLSNYYKKANVKLRTNLTNEISSKQMNKTLSNLIFLDNNLNESFWVTMIILFEKCASLLNKNGFFAVKTNGTIKSLLKCHLDEVFGYNNFINEIIIDSPFKVEYSSNSEVFERTNYILVYSKCSNPRIRPVFNKKKSGGYWHSFVSKGQGNPKKFIFNGREVFLTPPLGTHWKLNQKKIIELCNLGKIRLNKRGNPEYWVPSKIGQIIDTNWLDIVSFNLDSNHHFTNSIDLYERLINTFIDKTSLFLDLSANIGNSIIVAENLKVEWIVIEQNISNFKPLMENLLKNDIKVTVYQLDNNYNIKCNENNSFYLEKILNTSLSTQLPKKMSFSLIERYSINDLSSNHESNDQWRNMLIYGDSAEILPLLKQNMKKKIKIIYIDPPFFTGTNETIIIPISRSKGIKQGKIEIISYPVEDLAYNNVLDTNNVSSFVIWFKTRIQLMKSLLRDDGFIFVRFDYHFGYYAKLILDEVFGESNFVIDFLVRRMKKNLSQKQAYNQTHLIVHSDSVFVYQKTDEAKLDTSCIKKSGRKGQDLAEIEYFNDNLWIDIAGYQKLKQSLYPTENSESLLTRIIQSSTQEGDIVADFFCGSGTTVAVAEKLSRKWIGVDIGRYSIHEIRKRILKLPSWSSFNLMALTTNNDEKTLDNDSKNSPKVKFKTKINKNRLEISIINFFPTGYHKISEDHEFWDFIDFWNIDWNYKNDIFRPKWFSFRLLKGKKIIKDVELFAVNEYSRSGSFKVMISVVDVFGKSTNKLMHVIIT